MKPEGMPPQAAYPPVGAPDLPQVTTTRPNRRAYQAHVVATAGGAVIVAEAELTAGHLRIEQDCQAVADGTELRDYVVTSRTAWLDGVRVTDPVRAQELLEQMLEGDTDG